MLWNAIPWKWRLKMNLKVNEPRSMNRLNGGLIRWADRPNPADVQQAA